MLAAVATAVEVAAETTAGEERLVAIVGRTIAQIMIQLELLEVVGKKIPLSWIAHPWATTAVQMPWTQDLEEEAHLYSHA